MTAMAQVFNDTFANDSSLSSSYLNINNINGADQWAFTANSQLQLTAAGTGKLDDLARQFTSQTLAVGQTITFSAYFNSPNLVSGTGGGSILFALDNSGGVGLLSDGAGPESPTATTGATAGYLGYGGMIGLNATPKTSTKLFAKVGGVTDTNGFSYRGCESEYPVYSPARVWP